MVFGLAQPKLTLEILFFFFFYRRAIEIVESDVKSQTILKPLSECEQFISVSFSFIIRSFTFLKEIKR